MLSLQIVVIWSISHAHGYFNFFESLTVYANPITIPNALYPVTSLRNSDHISLGVASYIIYTTLLMGFLLITLKRWRLPMGALTLVFTLTAIFATVPTDTRFLVPSMVLAGLLADLLLLWLRPSLKDPFQLRLFAFLMPVTLYSCYTLNIAVLRGGLAWSAPVWTGSIVVAGIAGWLLTWVFVSPALPTTE
jgi:hypothetical protein